MSMAGDSILPAGSSGALLVVMTEGKVRWLDHALALKASTCNGVHQFHSYFIGQSKLHNDTLTHGGLEMLATLLLEWGWGISGRISLTALISAL